MYAVYRAIRAAAPAAYIILAWPHAAPTLAAAALLALELTALRTRHTPALYAHYAVAALMPPPAALALSTLLIPLLHIAKTIDNTASWKTHAAASAVATAANPHLAPLLAYTLAEAVWYYAKFAKDKPRVQAEGRLEAVAGRPLTYTLKIATSAPAEVELPDGRIAKINGEAQEKVRIKFDTAGVYAPELRLTYLSPTRTVRYVKRLPHPPIHVIPRARKALELGEKLLAKFETEYVSGAREYVPGDPLRRIHWKKTAKTLKPVVKLVEGGSSDVTSIAVLLYATTPKAMDKVLEAAASALAAVLTRAEEVDVIAVTRRGIEAYKATRQSYREVAERLLEMAEVLDAETKPAYDYADLLPKRAVAADLIIGEAALAKPLDVNMCICV
ncbi:DUF58 domain-containing protein [Pyrobaculum sp.]|uniref:DUF58 domain-containing protein n=2 Tax=Thermoprotei TaxID=183924 RepID=UPI003177E41C